MFLSGDYHLPSSEPQVNLLPISILSTDFYQPILKFLPPLKASATQHCCHNESVHIYSAIVIAWSTNGLRALHCFRCIETNGQNCLRCRFTAYQMEFLRMSMEYLIW